MHHLLGIHGVCVAVDWRDGEQEAGEGRAVLACESAFLDPLANIHGIADNLVHRHLSVNC